MPADYVGLVGFIPLLLGIKGCFDIIKETYEGWNQKEEMKTSAAELSKVEISRETSGNFPLTDISRAESPPITRKCSDRRLENSPSTHCSVENINEKENDDRSYEVEDEPVKVGTLHFGHSLSRRSMLLTNNLIPSEKDIQQATNLIPYDDESHNDTKEQNLEDREQLQQEINSEQGNREEISAFGKAIEKIFSACLNPVTLKVAATAVTIGSDNIAIYVSLFSQITPIEVAEVLICFYILLIIYIILALGTILYCKCIAALFEEYAEYFVPLLLVGLGIYIISGSILWGLMGA